MRLNEFASLRSELHVEISLNNSVRKKDEDSVVQMVKRYLLLFIDGVPNNASHFINEQLGLELADSVAKLFIGTTSEKDGQIVPVSQTLDKTAIHLYRLHIAESIEEEIGVSNDGDEQAIGSHQWELPNAEFEDYWEMLVFDDNIKNDLLSYVSALLHIAALGGNTSILSVSRLILLHGPPGTGKTSLSKAICQRLSIRLRGRFRRSVFIEVNSHSLFSKWFSESGKLVQKLFDQICRLLEETSCLVFVLIDEVESLTMSRQSAWSRNDPSDSVRAVNALLTQIDRIRRNLLLLCSYPNVFILTTSNLLDSVDVAFLDRADIKRFVSLPSPLAIYSIYSGCILEMQRIGIIHSDVVLISNTALILDEAVNSSHLDCSRVLMLISEKSVGLSGRVLRKIPVLAYGKQSSVLNHNKMLYDESLEKNSMSMNNFLDLMNSIVDDQLNDQIKLTHSSEKPVIQVSGSN